MESRPRERFPAVLPDHRSLRVALLRVEEVLLRVAPEREFGELLALLLGRNRGVPDLAALAVDAKAPSPEVENRGADRAELALAEAHEEEQLERDAVPPLGLRGDCGRRPRRRSVHARRAEAGACT
jgi:hypothetical protein